MVEVIADLEPVTEDGNRKRSRWELESLSAELRDDNGGEDREEERE